MRKFFRSPLFSAALSLLFILPSWVGRLLGLAGNVDTACTVAGKKTADCGSSPVIHWLINFADHYGSLWAAVVVIGYITFTLYQRRAIEDEQNANFDRKLVSAGKDWNSYVTESEARLKLIIDELKENGDQFEIAKKLIEEQKAHNTMLESWRSQRGTEIAINHEKTIR